MSTATETARRCTQCGANPARHAARFCEYCGAELPRLPAAEPAGTTPFGDVAARFAAIEGTAELEELLQATPYVKNPLGTASLVGSTVAAAFAIVVGVVVTIGMATAFPPLALVPLATVGLVLFNLGSTWIKSARFERQPLSRRTAMVVSTRTKITGGGRDQGTSTHYYATLQFPDGERRELEALEHVVGAVAPGDLGVAYGKGSYLVEFRRVQG